MDLRLKLDDTDFPTLVEAARAMIPSRAPDWTDHNVHDPGIMLIELMAWLAEAQIYALSRTRRDERLGYARMLGLDADGPRSARGMVWPEVAGGPGRSIAAGAAVTSDAPQVPDFRTVADQHLSPAVLARVVTRLADGRLVDNTRANRSEGASYLPFGPVPTPRDRLVFGFDGVAVAAGGTGAFALGVETDLPPEQDPGTGGVSVSMRDASGERPLRVIADETGGLARTGVIRLDIGPDEQVKAPGAADAFELIVAPRGGLQLLPRVRRIAANVVAIEQRQRQPDEIPDFGRGEPGQSYRLAADGRIADGPLEVTLDGAPWTLAPDLADCDPDAACFAFDAAAGELRFGNGVNGKVPPKGAALRVVYEVCGGTRGNAAAGTGWMLAGLAGVYGRNLRPCAGGRDALQLDDLRIAARRQLGERVAYVTPDDLEAAALALSDLRVVRARELPPEDGDLPGTRRLLAVAAGDPERAPGTAAETPAWIAAVRARLAPHLLAGQRLEVVAPRRLRLGVSARLGVAAAADPAQIAARARAELAARFADPATGDLVWKLGRDVTPLMVSGWLRRIAGVRIVSGVSLRRDGASVPAVAVGPTDLPWLEAPELGVERLPAGGSS